MRKIYTILFLLFISFPLFGQWKSVAYFNRSTQDQNDDTRPWKSGGVRSVVVTDDLDGDGKLEILATDYSNGGRVHVLELNGDVLEVVWSSPANLYEGNPNSTPRWVQYGDLDGDGLKEIIFPLGPRYDGGIQVYEFTGNDNDYGTQTIIDFPADLFTAQGTLRMRQDRERGTVYDFDGDGKDELIMANEDNKVYIIGINGNAPGFASWQLEGGDPSVHPNNGFSTGSWWHSLPCDYDGDGIKEIVNHYYNFYGFWSIKPAGSDQYSYPTRSNPDANVFGPVYYEFYKAADKDAVAWMGITAADVDGDGKQEIAGIVYPDYNISLISFPQGKSGVEVWDDPNNFAVLKTKEELSKSSALQQFWGCYAMDLNQNGRDEILLGGFYGENVVAVEYNGNGDILDGTNYDISYYYEGEKEIDTDWEKITISDSAGVIDTMYSKAVWENPGVMKFSAGDLLENDGQMELVVSYQSGSYTGSKVYDSTKVVLRTWNGSSWDETEHYEYNEKNIQIRVLQLEGGTSLRPIDIQVVTPDDYILEQNYPNPFNPSTTIRFSLPVNKQVSLIVYDMLGREVKTLIANEEIAKGAYEVDWDGTNNLNEKVASGNYIATLKFGNYHKSVKMSLLK